MTLAELIEKVEGLWGQRRKVEMNDGDLRIVPQPSGDFYLQEYRVDPCVAGYSVPDGWFALNVFPTVEAAIEAAREHTDAKEAAQRTEVTRKESLARFRSAHPPIYLQKERPDA